MKRHLTGAAALMLAAGMALADDIHRVAIHVDQSDPQVINMALNNVANLNSYYAEKGEEVVIELVAYGPGLTMFVEGKSPVADRVAAMSLEMENLSFAACGNTLRAMSKKAGTDVALLEEATIVPSGVVRLIELQEDGYAYIRP